MERRSIMGDISESVGRLAEAAALGVSRRGFMGWLGKGALAAGGWFTKGWAPGSGNPYGRQVAGRRKALSAAVPLRLPLSKQGVSSMMEIRRTFPEITSLEYDYAGADGNMPPGTREPGAPIRS